MRKKSSKVRIYNFILLLPLILLVVILSNFIFQILYINFLDYDRLESDLKDFLYREGGAPLSFKIENGISYYDYNDKIYGGTINNGKIVFNYSPNDYLIYVFGGSSVISPSQDKVFSYYLEKQLSELEQRKVHVFNFGLSGTESTTVKKRLASSTNIKNPDLIIIYSGHNDYNMPYKKSIKPNFYLVSKNFILNNLLRVAVKGDPRKIHKIEEIDGRITEAAQSIGLLNIRPDKFKRFNEIILQHFSYNVNDIVDIVNEKDIPAIFIIPISNLESRPAGINKITGNFYLVGINEKNYTKKINYLIAAKDSELFSFNIRSKSELNNYLRDLKDRNLKNIYILDLEKELIKEKFEFDYNSFLDDAHLNPETHNKTAHLLYNLITENQLCCD